MAIGFDSFGAALKSLPVFISGIDPLHHTTVEDLRFLVQHEIDLYVEGENNDLVCKRLCDTHTRLRKCKAFIARCEATTTNEDGAGRQSGV